MRGSTEFVGLLSTPFASSHLRILAQVTAFPAMVAIDVRRQEAGAMDWCCCCSRKRTATQVVPLSNVRQSAFPATVAIDERREEAGAMGWCCCCWRKRGATQVVPLSNIRQSSFQQVSIPLPPLRL